MSEPTPCPAGSYCTVGTIEPEPCPVGTYGSGENLKDSRECSPCPPGKYCWQRGWTSADDAPPCDAGYYCIGASREPTPTDEVTGEQCPAGSYCLEGTSDPESCEAGQFNAFKGGRSSDDCGDCWAGYYCSGESLGEPTGLCTAGNICPVGTVTPGVAPSTPASEGTYAPEGSSREWDCPIGTYASDPGSSECTDC